MISAKDLRKVELHREEEGYSREEVNSVIDQAADTIEAYANENKELYRKLELLAGRIEEYRKEEDSIKTALITAQKMADKIEQESKENAEKLISESEEKAKATVEEAEANAEKTVSEARDYAASLIKSKQEEANAAIAEAERKANEAINSSKIVAQDILDQAKSVSDDLVKTSKEQNEAYMLLNSALRKDAAEFIEKLKALYTEQLDALNSAKLESDTDAEEQEVEQLNVEVSSLLNEIDEIEEAIPEEITLDEPEEEEPEEEAAEEKPEDEAAEEETAEEEPEEADEDDAINIFEIIEDESETETAEPEEEEKIPAEEPAEAEVPEEEAEPEEEEKTDPMAAVEAFSRNEYSPVKSSPVREIVDEDDDDSLFESDEQPFESYFKINKKDPHFDKTQTISLVPPDDFEGEDDDEDGKHRSFFKRKR